MTERELEEYIKTVNQILLTQENVSTELQKRIQVLEQQVRVQNQTIQRLVSNSWMNIKQSYGYIDKAKLDYEMLLPLTPGSNNDIKKHRIIISLTTFPARMYEIKYTLFSLLKQSVQADEIFLWLTNEEFPQKEKCISKELLGWIVEHGITIRWCKNLRSYNKLIPTMREFPNDIIVTVDDDIVYSSDWLELLYRGYLKTGEICCHRAHKVMLQDDMIAPYGSWGFCTEGTSSFLNFFTGVGGVLYPPHSLYKDVTNEELFLDICPKADDIWLWTMAVLNHQKIHVVSKNIQTLTYVNLDRELGLTGEFRLGSYNVYGGGNDEQLRKVLWKYPEIMQILREEATTDVSVDWKGSSNYWEERYRKGGTSGAGSYNRLAKFKADVLNQFVKEYDIHSVVEWGCGDGNQLGLAQYPNYIGIDVSKTAVTRCSSIFKADSSKQFYWSGADSFDRIQIKGELALSLDVLYHLIEDEVFEQYLRDLFNSSTKFVCIYSCNFDKKHAKHVRCRKFTDYIMENISGWEFIGMIENQYPYDESDPDNTSWSDFYFYQRNI